MKFSNARGFDLQSAEHLKPGKFPAGGTFGLKTLCEMPLITSPCPDTIK